MSFDLQILITLLVSVNSYHKNERQHKHGQYNYRDNKCWIYILCSTGYIMLTLIASIYSLLLFASFCYSYEFGVHRTVIVLVGFTTTYAISEYHQ